MVFQRKGRRTAPTHDLPLALRSADGALAQTFPSHVVSSIRHMENALMYHGPLPSRIAMVSALSGEGVTYTSLALAATLAHDLPASICAVELNWYTPGMCARLSEPLAAKPGRRVKKKVAEPAPTPSSAFCNAVGLAGVLLNQITLDKALLPTALPNLSLLPAGLLPQQQRPTIARGEELKQIIDQLSRRFDHLILDIPAVHTTSDASALASLASGCCVVIRQGVTPATVVGRALDDLKHLTLLGVVLNQAHLELPRWMQHLLPNG